MSKIFRMFAENKIMRLEGFIEVTRYYYDGNTRINYDDKTQVNVKNITIFTGRKIELVSGEVIMVIETQEEIEKLIRDSRISYI